MHVLGDDDRMLAHRYRSWQAPDLLMQYLAKQDEAIHVRESLAWAHKGMCVKQ